MLEGGIRPTLCWISIFGGLPIMMGQHTSSEALFYSSRLEDQVPEHYLRRLIDKQIRFEFGQSMYGMNHTASSVYDPWGD
jgi:hypothetical protein